MIKTWKIGTASNDYLCFVFQNYIKNDYCLNELCKDFVFNMQKYFNTLNDQSAIERTVKSNVYNYPLIMLQFNRRRSLIKFIAIFWSQKKP